MASHPRILFVGTFPPHPGGSGVVNGLWLQGLHDAGFPLQVITPMSPETAGRTELVQRQFPEITLVEMPVATAVVEPWDDGFDSAENRRHLADTLAACDEAVRRQWPDLVLVGRIWYLLGVVAWARQRGLPLAVICHDGAVLLDGVCSPAARQRGLGTLQQVDLAVAPATHLADGLARIGITNVLAVPNGVDPTRFRPGPRDSHLAWSLGLNPHQVVVVHHSNMKPLKRASEIVEAAARAVRIDDRLVFLIIGDGQCRDALAEAARDFGVSEHFRFVGWVDHEAVPEYLRLADMAIMPSRTEGLAMAYLEAMATGLVLLASDIPAAREVIKDGERGFLFPVGDVGAMAEMILKAAADPDLRQRIGAAARVHVERHHHLERSINLLRLALERLVDRGRAVQTTSELPS